ncbi:hypothetical protein ACIA8O_08640 [Kitasatospora sp. NPDC051853]
MNAATLAQLAGPISEEPGPGLFLRIVLVASVVGVGLLGWAIARANRNS